MKDEVIYRGQVNMADPSAAGRKKSSPLVAASPPLSSASSSASVPASDDASNISISSSCRINEAVTAAAAVATTSSQNVVITADNNNNNNSGDEFHLAGGLRSGDTPPPPERKFGGIVVGSSANKISINSTTAATSASTSTGVAEVLPDPPSAAEESARKARSRLIQLQNSLGSGKNKQSSATAAVLATATETNSLAGAQNDLNEIDDDEDIGSSNTEKEDDDDDEEEEDYPQINVDPIESDDEVQLNNNGTSNDDDDEDESDEGDDIEESHDKSNLASHRIPPQQLMEKLHAGRGTFGRTTGDDDNTHVLDRSISPSWKPGGWSGGGGGHQQQLHHSSPQLLAKKKSIKSRRQSNELYSDGIDLLETAANEARERDEVNALNDSINYLRNLQMNEHHSTTKNNDGVTTISDGTTGNVRKQHFPPPPPPPPVVDPRLQYRPRSNSNRTDDSGDDDDDILQFRARSSSFDGDAQNDYNHHHQRPMPPPPPPIMQQQQLQSRQSSSVPSTPIDQKRNRPKITAAEAMDFIKNASSARLQKYTEENTGHDDSNKIVDDGNKAIGRMNAFLSTISGSREIEAPPSPGDDNGDINDDDEDILDHDDFEQNTSLSMHAEAKSPITPITMSRYAENKHKSIMHNAKCQLDRLSMDDRQNSLVDEQQHHNHRHNSLILGDEPITSNTPRRKSSIDPPDVDEFGLTSSNSHTANVRLYGAETLMSSSSPSSFEHGKFSRQSSKDIGKSAPMAALGPRSKRPGGITGVVLDVGSNRNDSHRQQIAPGRARASSYGASGSRGIDPQDTVVEKRSPGNVDGLSQSETERLMLRDDFGDDKSMRQMMVLCSHLLPIGFNSVFCNNYESDVSLRWDDEDPEELGYVVHRLTDSQLTSVENAFTKMVNTFEQLSANNMQMGTSDENFERDLKVAEMILDQEERRYEAEIKEARYLGEATSSDEDSDDSTKSDDSPARLGASPVYEGKKLEVENRACVPDFPGIYHPGEGKVGEMECFYLPIITKSQKTGFEPTKDLVLKPGSVFANNYLVQSELGSAAFSTAYRCIDLSSEEDDEGYQDEVCLKVIKNTKDYFDQSLDEIKILQLLKDTGRVRENNIVEMISFFYHREHLVIVTELLRQNLYEFGKSIRESRGPTYFNRRRLSHITRQCLIALKFVHELGLMHCDIKPENILLGSYSRALVKVIDFGSSSFVTDRQSSYIQSRSYRAPEVILGLPYGGKIDIWSLGCVIAEMYTGEVTFQNDSEVSMLSRIEAICGPFPRHMIAKGRNCHRIFTDSGLIYEKVAGRDPEESGSRSGSDEDDEDVFHVFQPKRTTIAARLGFDADFLERPKLSDGDEQRALFIDFVSKLLTVDPDLRPTAEEALQHPWILSSLDLTADDIRYPPDE